jgi:hypothetical protein
MGIGRRDDAMQTCWDVLLTGYEAPVVPTGKKVAEIRLRLPLSAAQRVMEGCHIPRTVHNEARRKREKPKTNDADVATGKLNDSSRLS